MSTNESRVNMTCRRQSVSYEHLERGRQKAVSGVNRMATRTQEREKTINKLSLSFSKVFMSTLTWKRDKELEREIKKTTETNFVGRKTWKF